jgi:ribosomal protein S4E
MKQRIVEATGNHYRVVENDDTTGKLHVIQGEVVADKRLRRTEDRHIVARLRPDDPLF